MQRHVARTLMSHFRLCSQDGDGEDAGRGYYDTASGDNGPPVGGQRWLIREGGGGVLASWVSGHVRPRDPGGGTVLTVSQ